MRNFDFPEKIADIGAEELRASVVSACLQVRGAAAAYLFGSRARGAPNPHDFDIAVLFDERVLDRSAMYAGEDELYALLHPTVHPLDVVCMNRADHLLLSRILRDRVPLYCGDDEYRREWEWHARYRVWDMQPFHQRYEDAALERLRRRTVSD